MPISTEATLRDIADRIRVELEIFPLIGQGGGLEMIALSAYPLVGPALKRRILDLSIDSRSLRRPILGRDPCGYGLTLRPVKNQQEVGERLFQEPWDQVVSDVTIWSPMHLSHAVTVLQYLSRLCLYNGFDGAGAVEDSTFKHRVWQITFLLRSASDFGPHFFVAYEQAVNELESLHPGYRNRIHKNRFEGTIDRKKPTSLEERYERLPRITRPVETRRLLLTEAAKEDETFYTLQSDLILAWKEQERKQPFTQPFESEIASPGIPGEAEVRRVLAASRDRTDAPAAAVTKMIAATMLHPDQLLQAEVKLFEGFAIVSTTTNKYTALNNFDSDLHRRSSSPKFSRVVDAATAIAYQAAIAGKSLDVVRAELRRWLDSVTEKFSVSMLLVALLQNGPRWFSYPSAYAHHGLDGQRDAMKGWRYYCHFDLGSAWPSIWRYQTEILGCNYPADFQPPRLANGSHCTPTDEILQSMTKTLGNLLDTPILGQSLDETVCRWNGLVGILHQLVLGLSFLRNFPFEPPQLLPFDDGWLLSPPEFLIYQKSLVVVEFPTLLQHLLVKVRQKFTDFSQALRAEGVELEFRGREFAAYGFWSLPYRSPRKDRLVSCWQEPCRWQCLNGLLHCPETEIYAGLHFNGMRHWSVTTLLESGQFSLTEVNWLHGHGEGHLQPLSHYRLEPGNSRLRRRAFDFLADRLGLRQIL